MNREEIKILLAQQFVVQIQTSQTCRNSGDDEASRSFMDGYIQDQRGLFLRQLEALQISETSEILQAFEYFGPFEISMYIQHSLAGSQELRDHDPFFLACLKLGNPDLSWEEAAKQLSAEGKWSMLRTNPQHAIVAPFQKKIDEAVQGFRQGKKTPDEIPYISDHMYMNSILCTRHHGSSEPDLFQHSRDLFEHAFSAFDNAKCALTVNQELRLAGIVALACKCLPNHDDFRHPWEKNTVRDYLKIARRGIAEFKELDDLLPPIDALISRVEQYAQHEIFSQPVAVAARVHEHDFEQKVRTVLVNAPRAISGFSPDVLEY